MATLSDIHAVTRAYEQLQPQADLVRRIKPISEQLKEVMSVGDVLAEYKPISEQLKGLYPPAGFLQDIRPMNDWLREHGPFPLADAVTAALGPNFLGDLQNLVALVRVDADGDTLASPASGNSNAQQSWLATLPTPALVALLIACLAAVQVVSFSLEDAAGVELPDPVQNAVASVCAVAALILAIVQARRGDS